MYSCPRHSNIVKMILSKNRPTSYFLFINAFSLKIYKLQNFARFQFGFSFPLLAKLVPFSSKVLFGIPINWKNLATLVWYLSLVIGDLIEFTNKVQGSSSQSSTNLGFFKILFYTIFCETHIKALILVRVQRDLNPRPTAPQAAILSKLNYGPFNV